MPNRNTKKSPKKLWKTPSPSKPSLSGANLQFADLEANTLEELSIEELSQTSGGQGFSKPLIIGHFNSKPLIISEEQWNAMNNFEFEPFTYEVIDLGLDDWNICTGQCNITYSAESFHRILGIGG